MSINSSAKSAVKPAPKAATKPAPKKNTEAKPVAKATTQKKAAPVAAKKVETKPASNKQVSKIVETQTRNAAVTQRGDTGNANKNSEPKHVQEFVGKSFLTNLLLGR